MIVFLIRGVLMWAAGSAAGMLLSLFFPSHVHAVASTVGGGGFSNFLLWCAIGGVLAYIGTAPKSDPAKSNWLTFVGHILWEGVTAILAGGIKLIAAAKTKAGV